MKEILTFILCLVVWFVGNLIPVDYKYYKKITLPNFAPPSIFYGIAWTIIYILIAYSMYKIFTTYKFKNIPISYKLTLLINWLFNQSFTIVFFGLKNNFLGFASCMGTFITSLFLYQSSLELKEKSTKPLVLYVLLSFFATILSLSIYLLNL